MSVSLGFAKQVAGLGLFLRLVLVCLRSSVGSVLRRVSPLGFGWQEAPRRLNVDLRFSFTLLVERGNSSNDNFLVALRPSRFLVVTAASVIRSFGRLFDNTRSLISDA